MTSQLRSLWTNSWTIAGAIVAGLSLLFFISFQFYELIMPSGNPYTGLWSFLVLPATLMIGLLLIPIGWLRERRRRRKIFPEVHDWPRFPHLDLNDPKQRKGVIVFLLGALVVIPLVGVSSYGGYHYTDSTQFCGQVCHSVMHPEFTSYQGSPHARVACTECHIGPGATWYVKSKMSGLRQVFAVMFETYSRPIPTPVKDLRPARDTCEQCHWPAKFFGSQLITRPHFASDENNTRTESRILVKTGGGDSSQGPASGIHWHMALSNKIEYIAADEARESIPWVRATSVGGRVTVYRSDGKSSQDPPPPGEVRLMDCVDCHNRPTHVIRPPDRAVNTSLEAGRLDRTLPYVKKVAVQALTEHYESEQEASQKIDLLIRDFYQKMKPELAEVRKSSINQAVEEVRALYHRSFFPRMKVNWRSYPDHIGHMFYDGCFRCHDNRHVSDDKKQIRKDCSVCHEFQSVVAGAENTFLQGLPAHPVKLDPYHQELSCSSCHSGGRAPERACDGCHTLQKMFASGKTPAAPQLQAAASPHADLDCDSCHDMSKPQNAATIAPQCETCHDKGQGELIKRWKDSIAPGRARAAKALDDLKQRPESGDLLQQLQPAFDELDRARTIHNPALAGAVYQHIITEASASSGRK
jgi:nitrate/TMAO reductase-like tetraheme cytochrome c subunit